MEEEKGSYLDDLSAYDFREVIDNYPLGNISYESAFNTVDLLHYNIIVCEGQIIKHSQITDAAYNYDNTYIEGFYYGMKQGYKIAAHKNEAKELMKEMGMDEHES